MTSGLRMQTSPSSPSGSARAFGVADLDLDGGQRSTDRLGMLLPFLAVDDGRERGGLGAAVAVSERAAASSRETLRACVAAASGDVGAPPPPIWRSEERSYLPNSGCVIIRQTTVFIAPQLVHRSRSIARIASPASKRPTFHTERTPVASPMIAAVCSPETWKSGFVTKRQVEGAAGASAAGGFRSKTLEPAVHRQAKQGDHVAMALHRALRPAGGAARVEDDRRIVLGDRHRRGALRRGRGSRARRNPTRSRPPARPARRLRDARAAFDPRPGAPARSRRRRRGSRRRSTSRSVRLRSRRG